MCVQKYINPHKNLLIMENNSNGKQKIIIGVILLALLVILASYVVYQNNQLNDSNAFLEDEKVKIEQDLEEMVAKYDAAIAENSDLSEELKLEREDIVLLRDSVKNLKSTNYSLIRRYRSKIETLEASNQELFKQNDSLRIVNQLLADDLTTAQDSILTQSAILDTLNVKNAELAEKIGVGAQLLVNSAKTVTYKRRNSGKLTETLRANRTDALRISFTIAENPLTEEKDHSALIQVQSPDGTVIRNVGATTLENGEEISFSDQTSIEYNNEDLDVISLIEVDRKGMTKGTYKVSIYVDNKLVSISGFVLK